MNRKFIIAVGLVSCAGIVFEIVLTRIFSLLFQYHFAFLALSLAILGISIGTALVKLLRLDARAGVILPRVLALLSLSFPAAAFLLATLPATGSVLLHVIVALAPFTLTGMAMALMFTLRAQWAGTLYGADLIGAAIGVAAALGLLSLLGAFNGVLALGIVVALAALILAWPPAHANAIAQASTSLPNPRRLALPVICLAVSILAVLANAGTRFIDDAPLRATADAPPDKTLLRVLGDPSFGARVVYSAWDPFARIDVVETNDDSQKLVFTDAGAGSYMLRFNGDLNSVASLKQSVEFVPFADRVITKTLIFGAGAGKDVLLAKLAGSNDITAVEVNPSMIDATRKFGSYNGNIYDQAGVKVHAGDARTFAESSRDLFDLIYLNLVYSQAAPPASQALVENYIFTREAFRAYLNRLSDTGRFAIIAHNGIEGTRAAITAIAALNDLGTPLPQTLDHLAVLMQNNANPTARPTVVLVSRQPFTPAELTTLQMAARALDLQQLHLPGGFDLGFKMLKDGATLEQFLSVDQTFELFPATDNQPFFYKLDPGMPAPITQALIAAAVLSGLLLVLLMGQARGSTPALAAYVAAIGAGFMLIEVPLIQRFQLLMGYPVLSLVLVLGTLLLAGGIGSLISQRWPVASLMKRVMVAGALIAAIGLVYLIALPAAVSVLIGQPVAVRALFIVLLTVPLGLAMGIPFPSALRVASAKPAPQIALLWGVNGAFSVLGSTLAMWLAMAAGFQYAMLAGIAAYLVLIFCASKLRA
jgi:predicted membrane-bound spermidine synthase